MELPEDVGELEPLVNVGYEGLVDSMSIPLPRAGDGKKRVVEVQRRPGPRYLKKNGEYNIKRRHVQKTRRYMDDIFHTVCNSPWWKLILLYAVFYLGFWFFWGLYYFSLRKTIREDKNSPNLWDCFFFSVQTATTIGFGGYTFSNSNYIGVTLESLSGFFFDAVFLGLLYAKFSRAAKGAAVIVFSKVCVVVRRDGVPTLCFRIGNIRKHQPVECTLKVYLGHWRVTAEGEEFYEFSELRMCNNLNPVLAVPWELWHPIDEESPLWNYPRKQMIRDRAEIFVLVEGMPDVTSQTFQARTSFTAREILWDHRFVPCVALAGTGGHYIVDFKLLSKAVKVDDSTTGSRELDFRDNASSGEPALDEL